MQPEALAPYAPLIWLAAFAAGMAGCLLAMELRPGDLRPRDLPSGGGAGRRWLRKLAAGVVLWLTGWAVASLAMRAYFPLFWMPFPTAASGAAMGLGLLGALGCVLALDRPRPIQRDRLLAGSLLAASSCCALLVALQGLSTPLSLAFRLGWVLLMMLVGTLLATTAWGLAAGMFLAVRPLLLRPFPEWMRLGENLPDALSLHPILVIATLEIVLGLILVRAGAEADREQDLRTAAENTWLRQICNCAFEGLVVHSDGVVVDVNASFCAMLGLQAEAVVGTPVRLYLPDAVLEAAPGKAVTFDVLPLVAVPEKDAALPVEALSRSIPYGSGSARLTAVRDISVRRAAERNVRDLQQLLELRREAEDLRERVQIASRANQAKSSFLAMMSHEIRTPMNAVLGLSSALLETEMSDAQRQIVTTIHESGESLLRLLNDILDYSKFDAGRMTLEKVAFSPATLTHEPVSIYGPAAMAKGLTMEAVCAPGLPPALMGDAGRIGQVLENLVSNAVKFTPSGSILIRACCVERRDGVARMIWEVQDTGIGIPREKQADLFDWFVQADDSITRRFGGTGLGLAISRRIVDQMEGLLEVESEPGRGSLFRVELRLEEAPAEAVATPVPHDESQILRSALTALGHPARLLLAEDNPTNQFVLVQMLHGFDVTVEVAADGEEAVVLARQRSYDAVFMDMRMPRMDGLQATREIRRLSGRSGAVPIIALTANAFPDDVTACRQAGMTQFLAKPLRKEQLCRTLTEALGGRVAPASPPHASAAIQPSVPVSVGAASASPGGQAPAIDRSVLSELVEALGRETVLRMVEIFRSEMETRLAAYTAGLAEPVLREEMHAVKGTAATAGAPRLSQLAARLEQRLSHGLPPDVPPEELREAFEAYLHGLAEMDLVPPLAA